MWIWKEAHLSLLQALGSRLQGHISCYEQRAPKSLIELELRGIVGDVVSFHKKEEYV